MENVPIEQTSNGTGRVDSLMLIKIQGRNGLLWWL